MNSGYIKNAKCDEPPMEGSLEKLTEEARFLKHM
jgi:hypothetical protein